MRRYHRNDAQVSAVRADRRQRSRAAAGDRSGGRLVQRVLGRSVPSGILLLMTQTLDAAIAKLSSLPAEEQDRVGHWLLDELRDDEHWAHQFRESQDALGKLAAEARADRTAGRTTALDPEHM